MYDDEKKFKFCGFLLGDFILEGIIVKINIF